MSEVSDSYMGPWLATFRDGPCAGHEHDRIWAVGPIERNLYLTQHPTRPEEWMLVGMEGVVPENPWPNQVHYQLDSVIGEAAADGEPVAYYKLVQDE